LRTNLACKKRTLAVTDASTAFAHPDVFVDRHLGPAQAEIETMLKTLGFSSLEEMVSKIVPENIRLKESLNIGAGLSEREVMARLRSMADKNKVMKSYIGLGYYDCVVPPVIQRNILENPGWYTQYTPYQAEIAQGRLEALFNFQTLVCELSGMEIANSSLLDESTAAAEAMTLCLRVNRKNKSKRFVVSNSCHPQNIEVMKTRARPLGIEVEVADLANLEIGDGLAGVMVQYPTTEGYVEDYAALSEKVHAAGGMVIASADLMALMMLTPPAKWGADVVIGSSQRFGVPMGFGGPHAAYMATRETYKRSVPGRIIGESKDADGNPALRLALQTREQHIRREKATSNICTAQVLLAVMASMYAVYHGPVGLKRIASRISLMAGVFEAGIRKLGLSSGGKSFFDTVAVAFSSQERADSVMNAAVAAGLNLRRLDSTTVTVSIDETTDPEDVQTLLGVFGGEQGSALSLKDLVPEVRGIDPSMLRNDKVLTQEIFNSMHSETEFLRYVSRLQSKDLSLTTSMIPLGSCTMKLNATTEMLGVTWPEFSNLHPFAPADQTVGYREMFDELEKWLGSVTGMDAVSLQPNAGSQGEYAGMLVIQTYHEARNDTARNVCLIPSSAHGTNPASAIMAGMRVVVIGCDDQGNIDLEDLKAKAEKHKDDLSAIMVTYPSTHGVFETGIKDICQIVHDNGGQVYLDGANMNAQVGICRPGDYGADVVHLNLHKTFCIPHGGGGPGMGPIGVQSHLAPFLPGHPMVEVGGDDAMGPVSAAPWGSPSILPISWSYIAMLGDAGLQKATELAMLNANYMAKRLENHYPVLFRGHEGLSAHEFILDVRGFKETTGIEVEDIAKRLMDYGFHAPTISWPVAGTMMVEPTESESKSELDRFCDAMLSIHAEIVAIEKGELDKVDNPLKNAPHTANCLVKAWDHPYSREQAVYPGGWATEHKFWPAVRRIDNVYGDRNLVCSCPPLSEYSEEQA
jgi:glycine dehydrogenase